MTPRRHPGWDPQLLREHRHAHGLTLDQAAEQIRALRLPDGRPAPAATFQMIGQHERGTSYPGPRYRQAYAQLYGVSPTDLGFHDPSRNPKPLATRRSARHHGRAQPANVGLERLWAHDALNTAFEEVTRVVAGPLERRRFLILSGTALTAVAHEWLVADPARITAALSGKTADAGVITDLTTTLDALRRLDDKLGGQAVHSMIVEQLRLVVGLLRNASYTQDDGQALHGIAAELARLAGWTSYDAGAHGTAQRYYLVGLRAAHEADAPGIGANILRCMAHQARTTGDPHTAVRLLRSARAGARGQLTQTEQAVIAAGLARAYGRIGDVPAARQSIDAAYRAIDRQNPNEDPGYIYWATSSTVASSAGEALLHIGEPQAAITHLRSSVNDMAADLPRDLSSYRTILAVAHARSGDPEEAISLGHHAIEATAESRSGIVGARVSELCREVHATGHPAARDLAEHARAVLGAATA